jgi:hypothetical protein
MDWIVNITGDETDLQELAKVWNQPDLTIEKENEGYILKSSHFTSLSSDQEVREKANELLIPLNAGIKLTLGALKPIEIAHTTQIMPDGKKMAFVMAYAVVHHRAFASAVLTKIDGTIEIENPADPVIPIFTLAQKNPQVAKMCQYINLDLNSWFTLYNILEILEEDGFKSIKRGGNHKKKADAFTQTADNYRVLGVKARHAKELTKKKRKIEIPPNPMNLSEAQDFIKMLIREWLEEKKKKNV